MDHEIRADKPHTPPVPINTSEHGNNMVTTQQSRQQRPLIYRSSTWISTGAVYLVFEDVDPVFRSACMTLAHAPTALVRTSSPATVANLQHNNSLWNFKTLLGF